MKVEEAFKFALPDIPTEQRVEEGMEGERMQVGGGVTGRETEGGREEEEERGDKRSKKIEHGLRERECKQIKGKSGRERETTETERAGEGERGRQSCWGVRCAWGTGLPGYRPRCGAPSAPTTSSGTRHHRSRSVSLACYPGALL